MTTRLHPDLPETPNQGARSWELPAPLNEIATAIEEARPGHVVTFGDLATIEAYRVAWHGIEWDGTPTDGGSELELTVLGTLRDGDWFALEAWNDYTGWGCQDGADLYVGPTREDVIANGLTNDGRGNLGLPLV